MYFKQGKLLSDEQDQCGTCLNVSKCPLVTALIQGVVLFTQGSALVHHCGSYEAEAPPALKLVN